MRFRTCAQVSAAPVPVKQSQTTSPFGYLRAPKQYSDMKSKSTATEEHIARLGAPFFVPLHPNSTEEGSNPNGRTPVKTPKDPKLYLLRPTNRVTEPGWRRQFVVTPASNVTVRSWSDGHPDGKLITLRRRCFHARFSSAHRGRVSPWARKRDNNDCEDKMDRVEQDVMSG